MKTPIFIQIAAICSVALISSFGSLIASGSFNTDMPAEKIYAAGEGVEADTSEITLMTNGANFTSFLQSNLKYPALAVENEIEGSVRLLCEIGTDGLVKDVRLLSEVDEILANEVIQAARKLTFIPATQNGYAISYSIIVPVRFELH